jgi:hypothetical protein
VRALREEEGALPELRRERVVERRVERPGAEPALRVVEERQAAEREALADAGAEERSRPSRRNTLPKPRPKLRLARPKVRGTPRRLIACLPESRRSWVSLIPWSS